MPRPCPLPRLAADSGDGWMCPLFRVPVVPGASAEPVLLLHTAGSTAHALHYGQDSLAGALARDGFAVFLGTHRGDVDAYGPDGDLRLADVVTRDLPAAVHAILADTGARRVHVVGFGLGALLALDVGARCAEEVASVTALAPPLRVQPTPSDARRLHQVAQLLPRHWAVPLRAVSRLGTPLVGATVSHGPRARGAMAYASADVPLSFATALLAWAAQGRVELVPGLELEEGLREASAPLQVVLGREDRIVCASSADALVAHWGGTVQRVSHPGYGHVDLVLGAGASVDVHRPAIDWMHGQRGRSWGDVEDVA